MLRRGGHNIPGGLLPRGFPGKHTDPATNAQEGDSPVSLSTLGSSLVVVNPWKTLGIPSTGAERTFIASTATRTGVGELSPTKNRLSASTGGEAAALISLFFLMPAYSGKKENTEENAKHFFVQNNLR